MNVNSYRYIVGLKQTRVHSRTRVRRPKVMPTLVSQNICFNVSKRLRFGWNSIWSLLHNSSEGGHIIHSYKRKSTAICIHHYSAKNIGRLSISFTQSRLASFWTFGSLGGPMRYILESFKICWAEYFDQLYTLYNQSNFKSPHSSLLSPWPVNSMLGWKVINSSLWNFHFGAPHVFW